MIKYIVLIFVLLMFIEFSVSKPQIVSVSWPGGGYFGNFSPFARRGPFVVVNPYIPPPVYPVYTPYYYGYY